MRINSIHNLGLLLLSSLGLAATGCGDGPICPSDLVMVIQSPDADGTVSSVDDLDPDAAGIQTDVTIRSNFEGGSEILLTVRDERTDMVSQYNATTNADGDASFASVTLPAGGVTLIAEGSSDCGTASDEATVNVFTDGLCDVTIDQEPLDTNFYAPIPVLNASLDSDAALPGFQATFSVVTGAGFDAELFVLDTATGVESSVGTITADGDGLGSFSTTLAEGQQIVRGTCSIVGTNAASATSTFIVDTVVPDCTLTNPAEGVTVTPDDDEDGDELNGIQMTWTGAVDDDGENDTQGEGTSFFRDTTEFVGTAVAADGTASATAEFTSPGSFEVRFETQDRAENACVGEFTASVIVDGCAITIDEPSALVSTDSDANDANGLQANFTVTVDTECVGQTVFVDCGEGEASAVAPAGGVTTVPNVTLDANASSENNANCTARVVNPDNFETSADRVVSWDTSAPSGILVFTSPDGLTCGDSILNDVANDADGDLSNGFQLEARVTAPLATTRVIAVSNSVCTPDACETVAPPAGASVPFDIQQGVNDIRAITGDGVGNTASTLECLISLEDIIVDIVGAAGTGLASSADGTVNAGGDLEMTVCATSTLTAATAELVVTTGGIPSAPAPMSFDILLGQFCTDAPFAFVEGAHELVVTVDEIAGTRTGSDTQVLLVDLTPPGPPTGFTAVSPNRQAIDVEWVAGAGTDRFILKFSTAPFVDFATEGTEVPGVGLATAFTIENLDAGTTYFVGVAAEDEVGNVSAAETLGPIIPEFDASGALPPPTLATASAVPRRFGQSIVAGNFNGDDFEDIAVSAPFMTVGLNDVAGQVYIYFGSATGLSATPDVTISGGAAFQTFGYSMTRLNWSITAADGLAISAPFGGVAFVFHGATLSAGDADLTTADADIDIVVDGTPNWFTNSFFGWSLASGELNSLTTLEELIIGAPTGGGVGGAVIINGGALTDTTITLSDTADDTDMAGLEAQLFQNPIAAANNGGLGNHVAFLGDMRTGDGVGDVAIGYASDNSSPVATEDNALFVLRGRTASGNPGMTFTTLGVNDLHVVNPTADTTNAFSFQIGSIGDVSGDGFRDLVVAGHREGTGQVWIIAGSDSGVTTLTSDADYLTRITGAAPGSPFFGTGLANNATETSPDINGDGLEDLVVGGGSDGATTFPGLFIWYGGNIPTGDVDVTSAAYTIEGPAEFVNGVVANEPTPIQATWAGDLNNDGLTDIVWSDWSAASATDAEGRMEILTDD